MVLMHWEMIKLVVTMILAKVMLKVVKQIMKQKSSSNKWINLKLINIINVWLNFKSKKLKKHNKKSLRRRWGRLDLKTEKTLTNSYNQFSILILLTCFLEKRQNFRFCLKYLKIPFNIFKRGCICFYMKHTINSLTQGMILTKIKNYLNNMEWEWRMIILRRTLLD